MLLYVHRFLGALAFSIIIEAFVILLLCYFLKKDLRISYIAVLGTLCTEPYVWFIFPTIFWYSSNFITFSGELSAFLFEALLYKFLGKLTWKMALLFSFAANAISYVAWRFL